MTDPLTALGGVASIMQIADVSLRLSSELRDCVRTVRHAPQELRSFDLDLVNFSFSLREFHKRSNSWLANLQESREKKMKRRHIAGVIQECKAVEDGFSTLLGRFFGKPGRLRSIYSLVDRWKWYFQKPMVGGLKLSLESAKSSVVLFVMLHMVEDLQRQVYELQKALQEIPKELEIQLHSTNQQLRAQRKATRLARKRLREHLEVAQYSAPIFFPDMQSILDETQTMELYATERLRKENRRIRRELPPTQSRYFQQRDPSPDLRPTAQGPYRPRPSPLDPNNAGISNTKPNESDPTHSTDSPPGSHLASERSVILPNDVNGAHGGHIDPWCSRSSVKSERRYVSPQLWEPRMYGSIIRDDGNGITETFGEWRPEASEMLPLSTASAGNTIDTALPSLSKSSKRDATIRGEGSISRRSDSSELQGIVRTEVEKIEGGQQSSTARSSPYKAVPPFIDEDWKGIRRRPST